MRRIGKLMIYAKLKIVILSACIVLMVNSCSKKAGSTEKAVPAINGSVDSVKKTAKGTDSLSPKAFVEKKFAEMVTARTAALQKEIDGYKGQYHTFLLNRESKKTEYLSKNVDGAQLVQRYMVESDKDVKGHMLDTIRSIESLEKYADAVTYEVKDSVLMSGLLNGKDNDGAEVLREVLPAQGQIFLLTPQMLYSWPGENCSAREVLSPKNAPFSVLAVWSSRDIYSGAADLFERYNTIHVDSLMSYSLNGFLLVANSKGSIGWINRDSCSYFEPTTTITKNAEYIYQAGFAWVFNGVWQCPIDSYTVEGELESSYGEREIYDFFNRLALHVDGNGEDNPEPYPDEIRGGAFSLYGWSIGEASVDSLPMIYLCTGGNSKDHYFLSDGKLFKYKSRFSQCPKFSQTLSSW
jgi:hypothetical protein